MIGEKNKSQQLTLQKLFLLILSLGVLTLGVSCFVLFKQQHKLTLRKWQQDTLQRSTATTASYYSNLVTKIVSGNLHDVEIILKDNQLKEGLESIVITESTFLPPDVLSTCNEGTSLSSIHSVPTCYTSSEGKLVMYHELNSAGYSVGYLKKTVVMPTIGVFGNRSFITTIVTVIACFFLIIGVMLFCLRYYFIQPIKYLVSTLQQEIPNTFSIENSGVLEIQTLAKSVRNALTAVKESQRRAQQLEYDNKIIHIAKQLSHDIRSPLAALKVVKDMGTAEMAPDLSKLLGLSIDRITDIANTILPKGEEKNSIASDIEPCFLWMLIDQIISEKRVEYRDDRDVSIQFECDQSPFLMNAFCNSTEFMRSISNVINNSIEAKVLHKPLEIRIRLYESEDHIVLSIIDNGKGIPFEFLSKVFEESFSHEKKQGTGLGLHQVKSAIESWSGKVSIESQVNVGTKIMIHLKKSEKPEWVADSIEIKKYDSIVVLDDEEYVFKILKDRFLEYGKKMEYFKNIKDFENTLETQSQNTLYLMDHDLKQNNTGLDLIEKHQLQSKAFLLTGNYDDKSVQQRAVKINTKILPKPLIYNLPVKEIDM